MAEELAVITRTYDLLIWTLNHCAKFPRAHHHGLGRRIEEHLYDMLDALVDAKYRSDKADALRFAALRVEQLRLLFRAAKDLRILALGSHEYAVNALADIGRQLAGWRRNATKRP